jgi:Predicted transcriptional regulator
MPQSERSAIIKEFLKWIEAKSKGSGATLQDAISHLELEITDMGATKRRCSEYVNACVRSGLISIHGLKFKITDEGKNWLQRKSLT